MPKKKCSNRSFSCVCVCVCVCVCLFVFMKATAPMHFFSVFSIEIWAFTQDHLNTLRDGEEKERKYVHASKPLSIEFIADR